MGWLAHIQQTDAIAHMTKQAVAHTVRCIVTCTEHDRPDRQRCVTDCSLQVQAGVDNLHELGSFERLVNHDDLGLAIVELEQRRHIVLKRLALVIGNGCRKSSGIQYST